jgi:hypothetical protein
MEITLKCEGPTTEAEALYDCWSSRYALVIRGKGLKFPAPFETLKFSIRNGQTRYVVHDVDSEFGGARTVYSYFNDNGTLVVKEVASYCANPRKGVDFEYSIRNKEVDETAFEIFLEKLGIRDYPTSGDSWKLI